MLPRVMTRYQMLPMAASPFRNCEEYYLNNELGMIFDQNDRFNIELRHLRVSLKGYFCARKSVIEDLRRKMHPLHIDEARHRVMKSLHIHG